MILISTLLVFVTGFFAFKAYKNKQGTKFRELSIISILALVAVVLISISNFQSNQSTNNQFRNSLHFIEIVSKELGVDKELGFSLSTDKYFTKEKEQHFITEDTRKNSENRKDIFFGESMKNIYALYENTEILEFSNGEI